MDAKGLLIKGSIGLAGAGAIGFAGYQAINSKQEAKEINNIQKKLEKEGYTPITKTSTSYEEILKSYVAITKSTESLKFGDFGGTADNANNRKAEDILWEHCEKALKEESDTNFNKAKKWCVEPISVNEILRKQGINALDGAVADTSSQEGWNKKITKYRENKNIPEGFKGLNLSATSSDSAITEAHRTTIKQKCNEIAKLKNHAAKYEEHLDIFKDWCTDKG